MKLNDRVAIVTGGLGGIGRAIVELFLQEGASVTIADVVDTDSSREFVAGLDQDRVRLLLTDVGEPEGAETVVQETVEQFGGVDVLVNSPSWDKVATLTEATVDDYDRQMTVMAKSYWLMARASMPQLLRSAHASVIQFASMQAYRALPGRAALQMAKGAVCALTRQLALDYGPAGVRVNSVLPGLVLHEKGWAMYRDPADPTRYASDNELALRQQCYPLRRFGTPEDVAPLVLFLACDDSAWITGTDILVDGGASIQLAEALVFPPFRRLWRSAAPEAWDASWQAEMP